MNWWFYIIYGVINSKCFCFKINCIFCILRSVSRVDIKINWFFGVIKL